MYCRNRWVAVVLLLAMAGQPATAGVALGQGEGSSPGETKQNPCEDTRYLALKSRDLNEMTEREYEYFMLKEKECGEYQRSIERSTSPSSGAARVAPGRSPELPGVLASVARPDSCQGLGVKKGRRAKEDAFVPGFFAGAFLGLIGTLIVYSAQDGVEPRLGDYPSDMTDGTCRLAFAQGFRDETKRKKRESALSGGIVGTLVIVSAVVIAVSQD